MLFLTQHELADSVLQDRISLSPCQLEQFVTTRAWADNMLTEIDMCCALFKLQIETKLAGAQILVDDVQLLEAGNHLFHIAIVLHRWTLHMMVLLVRS